MRKAIFILIILISSFSYGQEATKIVDPKLVGCWKGSEKDQQQEGVTPALRSVQVNPLRKVSRL